MFNINKEYNNYNKKGIYKDLYRELENKKHAENSFKANLKLPKKGIYKDIYKAIGEQSQKIVANNDIKPRKGIYKDMYESIAKETKNNLPENKDNSIWHTYPLKLLVYSNDAGNALKPLIGSFCAKLSWIPAIIYTLLSINSNKDGKDKTKELAFQGIASFLLPTIAVSTSRKITEKTIDKIPSKVKNSIKSKLVEYNSLNKLTNRLKSNGSGGGYKKLILSLSGIITLGFLAKPIDKIVKKYLEPCFAKEI